MKGISSLNSGRINEGYLRPMPNEHTQRSGFLNEAEIARINSRTDETRANLNDIINNNTRNPMPDFMVDDNPKMKKYVDLISSMINKRCGWSTYHSNVFVEINGKRGVLFFDDKGSAMVIGFTPMDKNDSSIFYCFKDYAANNKTADFIIDSGKLGIVQTLSILFDYVKNPVMYSKNIKEAAELSYDDASKLWSNPDMGKKKEMDNFMSGKGFNQIKLMTPEGVRALGDEIVNNNLDPVMVLQDLRNGTERGLRYRELLGGPDARNRAISPERYVAALKYILNSVGGNITVNAPAAVTQPAATQVVSNLGDWVYNGVDMNFLKARGGMDIWEKFLKEAKNYNESLRSMEIILRDFIAYTRATTEEKLSKEDLMGVPTAMFVSGIGGIGKSDTWDKLLKDPQLHMTDRDYYLKTNSSANPTELYRVVYQNNGKIIVLDDTPQLFDSKYSISFWKAATTVANKRKGFPWIESPDTRNKNLYYDMNDIKIGSVKSAKLRYLEECPKGAIASTYKSPSQKGREESEKKKVGTRIPNKLQLKSKFLIICNETEADIKALMPGANWGAIKSRLSFIAIAPPPEVIWAKIKGNLIADANLPQAWVPANMLDKVIAFIEDLLHKGEADNLSFRLFADMTLRYYIRRDLDWQKMIVDQLNETTTTQAKIR